MPDLAIHTENLGKSYPLRAGAGRMGRYRTLSEWMGGWFRPRADASSANSFWALQDVSLEVRAGECVGLIGPNGAGKSTLLRLLSRITEPTQGRARLWGRVAALLEVGTGFHPELTGRENIYLYGTLLGLRRREVTVRLDQIVDFAGVTEFLDMQVKRYSSGMYVRLAFAVASHLDPDILLVDEVLAVGDMEFRAKCMQRIRAALGSGCTVLFVSHQLSLISSLCPRCLVFQGGRLVHDGPSAGAIQHYLRPQEGKAAINLADTADRRPGTGRVRLTAAWMEAADGQPCALVQSGTTLHLMLTYRAEAGAQGASVRAQIRLLDPAGMPLLAHHSALVAGEAGHVIQGAAGQWTMEIQRLPLMPGSYVLAVDLRVDGVMADTVEPALPLDVVAGDFYGGGSLYKEGLGRFLVEAAWQHHPMPS